MGRERGRAHGFCEQSSRALEKKKKRVCTRTRASPRRTVGLSLVPPPCVTPAPTRTQIPPCTRIHMAPPAAAASRPGAHAARASIAVLALLSILPAPAAAAHHPGREFRVGDFLPAARRMQYHGVRGRRERRGERAGFGARSPPNLDPACFFSSPISSLPTGPHPLGRPPGPPLPPLPGRWPSESCWGGVEMRGKGSSTPHAHNCSAPSISHLISSHTFLTARHPAARPRRRLRRPDRHLQGPAGL